MPPVSSLLDDYGFCYFPPPLQTFFFPNRELLKSVYNPETGKYVLPINPVTGAPLKIPATEYAQRYDGQSLVLRSSKGIPYGEIGLDFFVLLVSLIKDPRTGVLFDEIDFHSVASVSRSLGINSSSRGVRGVGTRIVDMAQRIFHLELDFVSNYSDHISNSRLYQVTTGDYHIPKNSSRGFWARIHPSFIEFLTRFPMSPVDKNFYFSLPSAQEKKAFLWLSRVLYLIDTTKEDEKMDLSFSMDNLAKLFKWTNKNRSFNDLVRFLKAVKLEKFDSQLKFRVNTSTSQSLVLLKTCRKIEPGI